MPKKYTKPKKRRFSKVDRLRARENWANGMADKDNALDLSMFTDQGLPNGGLIQKWREQSKKPDSKTFGENWYEYSRKREKQDLETFFAETQSYQRKKLRNIFEEQQKFDLQHSQMLKVFETLVRSQFVLQKGADGSLVLPQIDQEYLSKVNTGFDLYNKIAKSRQDVLMSKEVQNKLLEMEMDLAEIVENDDENLSDFDTFIGDMNETTIHIDMVKSDPAYFNALKNHSDKLTNIMQLTSGQPVEPVSSKDEDAEQVDEEDEDEDLEDVFSSA